MKILTTSILIAAALGKLAVARCVSISSSTVAGLQGPSGIVFSKDRTTRVPQSTNTSPLVKLQDYGSQRVVSSGKDEGKSNVPPPPLEMIPLIISGSFSNRVDLVFFSDGYVQEERQKFIDDALRLAEDVSQNQTFNTVQPLLNFWAAFSPSEESGIGIDSPNKTPFGLYRVGSELRAVYYEYEDVGRAACESLGEQCDYPILLGNDPLYGGLGGDFTVITASIINGPLILRHELGHSILDVGEEYDGGPGYFGRNAAHDTNLDSIPWKKWLSNSSRIDANGNPIVERSVMTMQIYAWTLLNTTDPWSINFTSSGEYSRYKLEFSLSGVPNKEDLLVTLDGEDLGWVPRRAVGMDRWFYNFYFSESLAAGTHNLKFTLLNGMNEGKAQLCSAEILEYGTEDEFISKAGFYGLFPTFSDVNKTSYRPTNEDCLMRSVTYSNFCKVCLETLWLHLLRNITFIDNIRESCEEGYKVLSLDLLPLAQFRKSFTPSKEEYTIIWRRNKQLLPEFTNRTRIQIEDENSPGDYDVYVHFHTAEVRLESQNLESEATHHISTSCTTSKF